MGANSLSLGILMISVSALQNGSPLKVLCIGCHSDDIEIGCGGTILQMLASNPNLEFTWMVIRPRRQ